MGLCRCVSGWVGLVLWVCEGMLMLFLLFGFGGVGMRGM